jgi:hypothetical protein
MKMARRRRPTMIAMKQVWVTHQGNLRMNADIERNQAPRPQIAPSHPYLESSSESHHFFLLSCKKFLHGPVVVRDFYFTRRVR